MELEDRIFIPDFLKNYTNWEDEEIKFENGMYFSTPILKKDIFDYISFENPELSDLFKNGPFPINYFNKSEIEALAAFYHGSGYLSKEEFIALKDYKKEFLKGDIPSYSCSLEVMTANLRKKKVLIGNNNSGGYFIQNYQRNCRKPLQRVINPHFIDLSNNDITLGYNSYSKYLFLDINNEKFEIILTNAEMDLFQEMILNKFKVKRMNDVEKAQLYQIRKKIREGTKNKFTLTPFKKHIGVKLIPSNFVVTNSSN